MNFSTEEKAMWLEDWRRSGKKAWSYAKENGLIPQTFVSWTKREHKAGFVEVPIPVLPPTNATQEILIEKADIKIHIPVNLDRSELLVVMEMLGGML